MNPAVLKVLDLPQCALDAAGAFHTHWLAEARATLASACDVLTIVVPPAPHDHTDWRRSIARDLAREAAPRRVNVIAGDDDTAIAAAISFLAAAPGVTGQYLPVYGNDARNPAG